MKDKRQRMALAWPYGIADPHLYAYLAAAAASYPYGVPPPPSALGCYASSAVPLARSPPSFQPSPQIPMSPTVRPTPVTSSEFLGNLTNAYFRSNGIAGFAVGSHPASHPSFPISQNPMLRSPLDPAAMSLLAAQASSTLTSQHLTSSHFLASLDSARLAAAAAASNPGIQFPHPVPVTHPHQTGLSPPDSFVRRGSPQIHVPIATKIATSSSASSSSSSVTPKGLFRPFQTESERT